MQQVWLLSFLVMLSGNCGFQKHREVKLYHLYCGNMMPSDSILLSVKARCLGLLFADGRAERDWGRDGD